MAGLLAALTGGSHEEPEQELSEEQVKDEERQARARASLERLGLAGQIAVKSSKKVDRTADKDKQTAEGPIRLSTNDNQVQKTQVTLLSRIWSVLSRMNTTMERQLEGQEEQSLLEREHELEKHRIETQSPAGNLHGEGSGMGAILGGIGALLAPLALEVAPVVAGLAGLAALLNKLGLTPSGSGTPGPGGTPTGQPQSSTVLNPLPDWQKGGGLVGYVGRKTGLYHWHMDQSDQPKAVGGSTPTGQTVDNSVKTSPGLSLTPREQAFVKSISKYESGHGDPHEAVFGYGKYGKPNKRLTDMTIDEVQQYQHKLRENTRAAGIGRANGRIVGTSAVGSGQFVEGTMNATLAWMAKKGMIPKDWRHMKFSAELQDKMTVANAQRLGADPNQIEKWSGRQRRIIGSQWESYTGRNDRLNEMQRNIANAGIQPAPNKSSVQQPAQVDPNTGAVKTQSDLGKWISSLSFGAPLTYRNGWARSDQQREAMGPSLQQQVIRPERKKAPSAFAGPMKTVDDALKGITNHITNVFGAKGQQKAISVDSTGNIPSPSADTTTLNYKLYFHTQ